MDAVMLTSEFLDELEERAQRDYLGRLHQAFIDWYVEAEFGRPQWKFTDDALDGGIDAVIWCPDDVPPVTIVQSKFTERIGSSALGPSAYGEFREVVAALRYGGERLDELVACVRDDLRPLYRKAHERLSGLTWHNAKKAFRLITTYKPRSGQDVDGLPTQNLVFAEDILQLYRQFRQIWTPKAKPLGLFVQDKLCYTDPVRRVTSYLFNARVSDFRKYLERNDVSRLVARNIRFNLAGKVGQGIRATYEKKPHDFWYLHNGLTIVCDEYTEANQTATLMNPSVINGAQSLYAIAASASTSSPAMVTVRVIVRKTAEGGYSEDDEWLQQVIRGVNTQNRVRPADFRSNEPEQIELQKRFREQKVFYERKRGEWREMRNDPRFRNFERLPLQQLGQIVTAVHDPDGHGVLLVKRGMNAIFEGEKYHKLFPSRATVARRFKMIYLAYRLFRLLRWVGYSNAKEFKTQRHGFWNTLWIMHRGICSIDRLQGQISLRGVKVVFDDFEQGKTMRARRGCKVVKEVVRAVWTAYRKARRPDPEHWTPNNFFKAKYGVQSLLKRAYPKVKYDLQAIGKCLVEQSRSG